MDKINRLRSRTKYGESGSNGLLDKITRRYSSVSNKFLRRSPGRLGSPQPVSTGSYDMTGIESEDHRIEIGAPILISKTYIDDHLNTIEKTKKEEQTKSPNESITSEEEFVDARDTFSNSEKIHEDDVVSHGQGSYDVTTPDHRPQSPPPPPPLQSLTSYHPPSPPSNASSTPPPLPESSPPELTPEVTPQSTPKYIQHQSPQQSPLNTPQPNENNERPFVYRAVRSKSAQNLHKSEMQVYLEKTPSLKNISPNGTLKKQHAPPPPPPASILSNDDNNPFESSSTLNNNDIHYLSKVSFDDHDFDLKSISFESLHLSNNDDYESLRDINWIREEFDRTVNLEYCEHRDKLKPCERRITLLRNKNNRIVNLDGKKEKFSSAWSGLKNWIGDEKSKIKEVVQKHAAMQRVGAGNIIKNQAFFDKMRKDDHSGIGGGACKSCDTQVGGTMERDWEEESVRGGTVSRTVSTSEVSTRDGSEEKNTRNAVKKSIHEVSYVFVMHVI